jgi:uncharacterized membrane protein YqhA
MKTVVEKSRYLALIAVIGLLIAAIVAFGWGFYNACLLVYKVTIGLSASTSVIIDLEKIVDVFLIATTLLIFAASLYELFITEIDVPDWMIAQLSSMIVLILAVKFSEEVFLAKDAYDLMLTGIAIAVISAVLIAFSYFGKKD